MSDEELRKYEAMWTTERDQYLLVRHISKHGVPMLAYTIYWRYVGELDVAFSLVNIEDDELSHLIEQKLLQAGVPTMEEDEFFRLYDELDRTAG